MLFCIVRKRLLNEKSKEVFEIVIGLFQLLELELNNACLTIIHIQSMESLKRAIGSGGDEGGGTTTWFGELTGASNESCCPSLSYKQVLIILCLLIDYYANYSVIFIIENGKNIYFFIFALENYWHCRMCRRCICADYGRKYKQYCLYSRVINFRSVDIFHCHAHHFRYSL